MRRFACVLVGSVALVGVACGDDDAPGGGSSSGTTSSSSGNDIGGGSSSSSGSDTSGNSSSGGLQLSGYATAICEKVEKCSPGSFTQSWAIKAECIGDVQASNKEGVGSLPGAIITQAQIDACAKQISESTCAFGLNDLDACVLKGTLIGGTPCYDGRQCQAGRCKRTSPSADCGTCASFEAAGGACLEDGDCELGTTCFEGACAKLLAKNDPCTIDGKRCRAGLTCANGTCADALEEGGACTTNGNECRRGLVCANAKCVNPSVKVAALGESCDESTVCRKSSCRGAAGSAKCVAYVATGATCGSELNEAPDCEGENFCANGTCEANTYPDCR